MGKSTLFNKLAGQNIALVDNTPGLTRDRKEAEFKMFGVKIRIVDTAGVDDFEENKNYSEVINKTIEQTRKGLIYSDLALFLIDARQGITFTDIKLADWINKIKNKQLEQLGSKKNIGHSLSNNNNDENAGVNDIGNENEKNDDNPNDNNQYKSKAGKNAENKIKNERGLFYEKLKQLKETDEITMPEVKLIANKAENDFVADDVFADFKRLKLGEPLLISAEHGDHMV